jgi:hypothetical protein
MVLVALAPTTIIPELERVVAPVPITIIRELALVVVLAVPVQQTVLVLAVAPAAFVLIGKG